MSMIRPLAPATCSNCNATASLYLETDERIRCRLCGHVEKQTINVPPPVKVNEVARPKFRPSYRVTQKSPIDTWARAAYDTGQDCIGREDYEGAIKAFKRALESEKNFLDAHFWIGVLSEDPVEKRDHLTTVLAYDPNHLEAVRELMVLDGKLTREQARHTGDYDQPQIRSAELPVGTQTTVLRCPVCEADLTINDESGLVECKYCGHTQRVNPQQTESASLLLALMERKAQAVKWVIGERLLHCNNCGAERTIPGTDLSSRCPFCGSNHVIEQDALQSFEQPDCLLPFSVSRQEAIANIMSKLDSWSERIRGWFDDNRVRGGTMEAVFLPFWIFDAYVEVTKTTFDKRMSQRRQSARHFQPYHSTTIPEMIKDLPICAVTSPAPRLTEKLGKFNLNAMTAYRPELLAKYPAELYTLDFDRASLEARSVIGKAMRQKHGRSMNSDIQVNIFSGVKQMSFQLVLLPVWIATLKEKDGDTRLALVNGQSGAVVLGKAGR